MKIVETNTRYSKKKGSYSVDVTKVKGLKTIEEARLRVKELYPSAVFHSVTEATVKGFIYPTYIRIIGS